MENAFTLLPTSVFGENDNGDIQNESRKRNGKEMDFSLFFVGGGVKRGIYGKNLKNIFFILLYKYILL